jgi:hypothetical protein
MELISLETGNVSITYETLPEFITSNFKSFTEKHDGFSSEDKQKNIAVGLSDIKTKYISSFFYIALALLFQPFVKIALGRTIWNIVDVIVGIGLLVSLFINKSPKKLNDN